MQVSYPLLGITKDITAILEQLDSAIALAIDHLEEKKEGNITDDHYEVLDEFLYDLEEIRGQINA